MSKKAPDRDFALPHPKLWAKMVSLDAARETAKNRRADAITNKNGIEKKLRELGHKKTDEVKELAVDHWRTLEKIDLLADEIKSLADKTGRVLREAASGRQIEVESFLDQIDNDEHEEEEEEDDDPEQMKLHPKPTTGAPRDGEKIGKPELGKELTPERRKRAHDFITAATMGLAAHPGDRKLAWNATKELPEHWDGKHLKEIVADINELVDADPAVVGAIVGKLSNMANINLEFYLDIFGSDSAVNRAVLKNDEEEKRLHAKPERLGNPLDVKLADAVSQNDTSKLTAAGLITFGDLNTFMEKNEGDAGKLQEETGLSKPAVKWLCEELKRRSGRFAAPAPEKTPSKKGKKK